MEANEITYSICTYVNMHVDVAKPTRATESKRVKSPGRDTPIRSADARSANEGKSIGLFAYIAFGKNTFSTSSMSSFGRICGIHLQPLHRSNYSVTLLERNAYLMFTISKFVAWPLEAILECKSVHK